jgi:hypothetical protein
MNRDRSPLFPKKKGAIGDSPRQEDLLPPWLFKHQHIFREVPDALQVDQEALKNRLNHLHFTGKPILVHLRLPQYKEGILVQAYPGPCLGKELTCRWSDEHLFSNDLEDYRFLNLVIDDGKHLILVPGVLQEIDRNCLIIELPQTSYAVGQRQARRYACHNTFVELHQSGFLAKGRLLDFNPLGFRIRVRPVMSSSFQWFNSDAPAIVHLRHQQEISFSGLCHCTRQEGDFVERELVLAPAEEKISRFRKNRTRNPRQRLVPSPTLVFTHPFLNKTVQLEVSDISTSGFSVYEKADEGLLMQGMIIPELTIDFAGSSSMKCVAQVIYRMDEQEKGVRWGIAILDMDITGYSRLTHILGNALDPHAHISSEVDIDTLWEFLFDSGFIYPTKYRLIQSHQKDYKETYRKLYQENPEIAKHFTYQENGRIWGHLSMVRAYEKTWMIHHHAARSTEKKRSGFMVLKQTMHYLNDMHRLPSAKMDYVMAYFRPDSGFPVQVFGGFATELKNPRGCSMDLFSYLPYPTLSLGTKLPEGWLLQESSSPDLWELSRFYKHQSGGLLLDILGTRDNSSPEESIEKLYDRLGFMRTWKLYSLTHEGALNAVMIIDHSDLGLNLSELLNGIKILVTNPEALPWDIVSIAIGQLAPLYKMDKVPVLIYPIEYVATKGIPYEKQYQLWILNVQYGHEYMEYMRRKFRISYE